MSAVLLKELQPVLSIKIVFVFEIVKIRKWMMRDIRKI